MEAKPVSEKRKRLSPPLPHNNGLDASSLDSSLRTKPDAKTRRLESSRSRFSGRSDLLPRHLVKDLRSHRVFSPSSELYKELSHQKLGFDDSEDDSKSTQSEDISEQTGKAGLGFLNSETIDVLDEKCAEKTPSPEANAYADPGSSENCGNGIGMGNGIAKPPKGNAQNKIDSDSTTKPFLRQCFRGKVFKTPGSLGYRRLLPYLMDISKNDSGEVENDQSPKLYKASEEKKPQAMQTSQSEVASKNGIGKNKILVECPELDKFSDEKQHQDMQASPSEEASKDGVDKIIILGESPELDKASEEKQPQLLQASRGEEASEDCVDKNRVSVEHQNCHYDIIVQDCAIESSRADKLNLTFSENVSLWPSIAGADECWSMPPVNDIPNSKVGLYCNDQKSTYLDCHVLYATKDLQDASDDFLSTLSEDDKPVDYAGSMETDGWFPCNNIQDGSTEEIKSLDVESQIPNKMNDQSGGNDDDDVLNQADNPNDESNQMTPPDAEIFGKPEVEGNEVDGADYVQQNSDPLIEKLPSGVNHGNASLDYNTRQETNSKCRSVSKPRSRMKLFRSPGSVSYGRMLPFLMDIANDNSAYGQRANPQTDLKRPSLLASESLEIPSDISNGVRFEENRKDHSAALQMAVQTSDQESSKEKENGISAEHGTDIQTSFISQKEDPLQVIEAASSKTSEMETSPKHSSLEQAVQDTGRPVASLCFSNCVSSSREELSVSNSNQSSVETEGNLPRSTLKSSDGVKSFEEDELCYASPQTQVIPVSSVTPAGVPKKGILKRNPRGCRGLCTCLNCASFRLHAERGFEFSRNQMEDAEEVVLDLIKEMSCLRNVLEKSADAADNHFINANQVKEACRKASEAEELAKDRLNQMKYDLGVHCRITCLEPPRVRFANRVEENIIPKTSFRTKQVLEHEKENGQRETKTS